MLRTENVRRLVLGPVPLAGASTALRVDGAPVPGVDLRAPVGLLRRHPGGPWEVAGGHPPRARSAPP